MESFGIFPCIKNMTETDMFFFCKKFFFEIRTGRKYVSHKFFIITLSEVLFRMLFADRLKLPVGRDNSCMGFGRVLRI